MENKDNLNQIELILPAIRMILSKYTLLSLKVRDNELVRYYSDNEDNQNKILNIDTSGTLESVGTSYMFLNDDSVNSMLETANSEIPIFRENKGDNPKIILIKGIGMVSVGRNANECDSLLNTFEEVLNASYKMASESEHGKITEKLKGAMLQDKSIGAYDDEFERRANRAYNKTIIVTGAAQGFGEGIARKLLMEGANIVVADLNEEVGNKTVKHFNTLTKNNQAIFVKTNVADMDSIKNMVQKTISTFGGIDVFISNAGVLRAGGLDDMTPEDFDFVTKINYNAYFYCTKVVSSVMKLQTKYASPNYFADVIQINSKSGLRGSKANFAYAGGKFGGIGLTQSFALELAPYRIKVNSICPGNYYEGPLWSDPENGLFTQYLKAGKVPGAKTVDEVKAFYLAQVPMNKGCTPDDVVKGVLYLMDQCSETGQALPITGGQVMLN